MEGQRYNLDRISSIRIVPFDSSCLERKYLASYGARYFEISESLALFVELLGRTRSFSETARQFSVIRDRQYSEDDVKTVYRQYVLPIIEGQPGKPKMFIWSKELFSPEAVGRISCLFRILFKPIVMVIALFCIIALEILFFSQDLTVSIGDIDMFYIIVIALLFLVSSCVHELGHASACSYFQAQPGGIGFGLYLNFPVFYTDVSDIWTIDRKKRMVVNFSGIYFQLIFLIPFFAVYFITGSQLVKYFIYTINLNFIFTLNPFFKFDGYWAMSDFIGVSNLREKSKSILHYVKNMILKKNGERDGFVSTMRIRERIIFIGYSVIVNIFFLYYFIFVLPKFIQSFVVGFPDLIEYVVTLVATGEMPSFGAISSIAGQFVMAALIIFFIYNMIAGLVKRKKNG